jgi:hypothetical protein
VDETTLRARIQAYLDQAGLGAVIPTLSRAYRRERSEVWSATLTSPVGDAWMQLFVYDLAADPAGIVDVNEERLALNELAKVQPSDLVPHLVTETISDDLAVLVAASASDASMLRRYLAPQERGTGPRLSYQPQLDRLFGADTIKEVNGKLLASWLMSAERAKRLAAVMAQLASAGDVTGRDELPFPVPVQAYLTETLEQAGVEIESLGEIPPEYAEPARLEALVTPGKPLGVRPRLPSDSSAGTLASRLFTTVRIAHGLPATFSRGAGCCLRGEWVTAVGELIDVYFLTAADELNAAQLERGRLVDMANALQLLSLVISESGPLEEAFGVAITAYLGSSAPSELLSLGADTARLTAGQPFDMAISAPLAGLARAMRRAGPP